MKKREINSVLHTVSFSFFLYQNVNPFFHMLLNPPKSLENTSFCVPFFTLFPMLLCMLFCALPVMSVYSTNEEILSQSSVSFHSIQHIFLSQPSTLSYIFCFWLLPYRKWNSLQPVHLKVVLFWILSNLPFVRFPPNYKIFPASYNPIFVFAVLVCKAKASPS